MVKFAYACIAALVAVAIGQQFHPSVNTYLAQRLSDGAWTLSGEILVFASLRPCYEGQIVAFVDGKAGCKYPDIEPAAGIRMSGGTGEIATVFSGTIGSPDATVSTRCKAVSKRAGRFVINCNGIIYEFAYKEPK